MSLLTVIILVVIVIGVLMLIGLLKERKKHGSLASHNVSLDNGEQPGKTYSSDKLKLKGRPDGLIIQDKYCIPIEYKSSTSPIKPYRNHEAQLTAYCALIEDCEGTTPPYGIIKYGNGTEFKIQYNKYKRQEIIQLIDEILECRRTNKEIQCNHSWHNILT